MASRISRFLPRTRLQTSPSYICPHCRRYASTTTSSSSSPAPPPLLLKLRTDLKTAMKAKDTNRLNVLRAILAEVTNQAKTSNPINTDMQLLSLLRKRATAANTAAAEFKAAGRQDLTEREESQAAVMNEYAGGVETMSESDVKQAVDKVVEEVKAAATGQGKVNMGDVLKKLLAAGGSLEGKPVERSEVARMVKDALQA